MKTEYARIPPFVTKDGSVIRELMHPTVHAVRHQRLAETANATSLSRGPRLMSLAEATVAPGQTTTLHRHHASEELYHITAGRGRMTLGAESFEVVAGDTICIPPGTPHRIANTGAGPLHILCCCTPPYAHDDTELLEC